MEVAVFEQIFGLLPEPSALVSLSGEILAWNRPLADILGYRRTTRLDGLALQDIVNDSADKVSHFLRLCGRSRDLLPGALTCKTATGEHLRCRVEGARLSLNSENARGTLLLRIFPKRAEQSRFSVLNDRIEALHREILERRRTQARLHAERQWLQTTLASIGDAVIATDDRGHIVFMNSMAESLTGWAQSEAAGLPLEVAFNIVNEETRQPVVSPVAEVLARGTIVGLANHTVLIGRDGSERPVADSAAPIRDEAGKMIGVVLVFRDVTGAQKAQRLILQSERRFRRIFNTANVAIWEQDFSAVKKSMRALEETGVNLPEYFSAHPEFLEQAVRQLRTVDVNYAALKLFGAETKEELLEALPRIFIPETYSIFGDELLTIARGESIFHSEAPVLTLQGKRLQVLFAMSFPSDDPDLSSVLVSLMDISDRKQGEEALRRANEALKRANGDLEHFAYAAAHDLQEPLRNVVLYTQVLQRRYNEVLDEHGRAACRISVDGARRMQALVQGLLDYTRVLAESDVERDTELQSRIDCAQIVAAVQENLRTSIEESHARIVCDEMPVVRARDTHLIQLFQNLLSNAIKYRKPGQDVEIRIRARQERGEWIFSVEDNGVGVGLQYQRRIFEAFKRLHGREIPGVGMGLTICSRIVAHYGGRIWVESQEGRGSTFAFTLPEQK
jgi:PAS domain S-box-containing protein